MRNQLKTKQRTTNANATNNEGRKWKDAYWFLVDLTFNFLVAAFTALIALAVFEIGAVLTAGQLILILAIGASIEIEAPTTPTVLKEVVACKAIKI